MQLNSNPVPHPDSTASSCHVCFGSEKQQDHSIKYFDAVQLVTSVQEPSKYSLTEQSWLNVHLLLSEFSIKSSSVAEGVCSVVIMMHLLRWELSSCYDWTLALLRCVACGLEVLSRLSDCYSSWSSSSTLSCSCFVKRLCARPKMNLNAYQINTFVPICNLFMSHVGWILCFLWILWRTAWEIRGKKGKFETGRITKGSKVKEKSLRENGEF